LKRLFGIWRTFEANAAGIFGKFESFAKGFIDAGNLRFYGEIAVPEQDGDAGAAHFNSLFTMTGRGHRVASDRMRRP
jgi:hypothetical protein